MTQRILWVAAAVALFEYGGPPRAAALPGGEDADVLRDGTTVEQPLGTHDSHRYAVPMHAGEYARVVVEQHRIDLVVQVRSVDDRLIAEFQDVVGDTGEEQVEIAAAESGPCTVVVSAAPGTIEPGAYAIRLVSRRASTDSDRKLQEARTLRTAATALVERERMESARPLVERALALTEEARSADDEEVGAVLAQAADVYMDRPDFTAAEASYQRALAIFDRTRGSASAATAIVRSRLATLYQRKGDRPRAEAVLRSATDVIERALGPQHIAYARCLGTLAALRIDGGDLVAAADILQRELSILERIDYTETILYAGVLNNLGGVYGRRREYPRAEEYLQRALALGERLRGSDDYFLSKPLLNLGVIARERKDYRTAESFHVRALAIRQAVSGDESPELGLILNDLANIYHATGNYDRALQTHFRALRIGERGFGPYHQNTLLSVGNIARVSAAIGDVKTAVAYERRADAIIEMQLALNLSVGSERQKQLFVQSMSERTDRTLSLHLDRAPDNADAAALAALVLLQRKGRVLDAMLDTFSVVRRRTPGARDQALLAAFNQTATRLADVALRSSLHEGYEARRDTVRELEAEKERLETALAEHSAQFRAQLRPVTLESVQAAIPDDAALIEFGVFRPFDPTAERTVDAYGPPHYAAYVVRKSGVPRGVDLGDAKALDDEIMAAHREWRDPHRSDSARLATGLYVRVLRPLAEYYGDARRLLIAPDGNLSLIPFEALVDEQSQPVIARYRVTYLTSGRDLLRMRVKHTSAQPPVVVADPLFGEPNAPSSSALYFSPLPGSAAEGRAIKALFPDSLLLTGSRATKAAIQQAHAPAILHLASHGFFVRTTDAGPNQIGGPAADTRALSASVDVDNPLLRSGLALAGANVGGRDRDGGILTALEASGLDLWGTKLVTLSACDTGVGEVRNGEGVYGLRRAFVLAGAESLVMSLWPVSDAIARETMVSYYKALRAGVGRGDALRQAKLAMMQRHPHPFYWASFIQSGEWANLDGRR
jgi:CHAT domain-containing protein/Tfp pilus assembly protein PilF